MKTIKFNPKETGWVSIDGDVATIVAHFENGEKKNDEFCWFCDYEQKKVQ